MLKEKYPFYLANKPMEPNHDLEVLNKYSGKVATRVAMASPEIIDEAIAAAVQASRPMAKMPTYQRQDVLNHCVKRFTERADELAQALCVEAGKPIRDSRGEVSRLIDTFRIAAEESVRMTGEVMPLDISSRARGYSGMWKRVPIGPVSFITPFNFPLNLAAHKVAPALAAGCPFVLKPSSRTPIGAIIIGEVLAETNLPAGAFSILPTRVEDAHIFAEDERLKLLSFTGSTNVGWNLKARAGKKKVMLELGGNAAVIVDSDSDLDDAVARIVIGAFYQSGQSCISVQRIFVNEIVYDTFKAKLIDATMKLKTGDPMNEETFIGPMIAVKEAERAESWIRSAVSRGGKLLCGGHRNGAFLDATLLEDVPKDEPLCAKEAFAPVAVMSRFSDFGEALALVNDSEYGLQAGIFTRDIYKAHRAWDELDVGGVIIGDVPSWRVDHMPYGGVKNSGIGREGIRFSMEEMTEIRLMVLRTK
ncbi:MAG: aldehyde dehydrogenase family protein [Candidatus Riflebacteria bacterium]|nr:aldehyde dehydrogenase family protein [Candidatus Riflebacteria bacterium]